MVWFFEHFWNVQMIKFKIIIHFGQKFYENLWSSLLCLTADTAAIKSIIFTIGIFLKFQLIKICLVDLKLDRVLKNL